MREPTERSWCKEAIFCAGTEELIGSFDIIEDGDVICGIGYWVCDAEAKANLVAAAPALLAACKVALKVLESHDHDRMQEARDVLMAALRKAHGEGANDE